MINEKRKLKINEIRFREIGFALRRGEKIDNDLRLKIKRYKAAGGDEYFLEFVNKQNLLFGLLRLRVQKNKKIPAIVRELHVYGPSLELGEKGKGIQHHGLGKRLLKKAEEIVGKNKINKLKIISGIGVRKYYARFGYVLDKEGIYVEKEFNY